jgi:hypothetical protein
MTPEKIRNKRVLISPLNWGMGHVSRCIGLIHQLIQQENEIFIACDQNQQQIFETYFQDVNFISHAGYPFEFRGQGNFSWDVLLRFSSLAKRLRLERKQVKEMVEQYSIDVVLADHRYGFHSKNVPSIFITHQFNLPLKWYEVVIAGRHRSLMFTFDSIWIMDNDKFQFAGKLSISGGEKKVSYIGAYSRFMLYEIPEKKEGETVLVISGPAIYGQQLLNERIHEIDQDSFSVIASPEIEVPENVLRISNDWKEQDQVLLHAKKIISRSGYSTLLDLHFLKTDAELYATKGQEEQVYLLERYSEELKLKN